MAGIDRWLVVGSRRWARIVVAELCGMLAPGSSIHLLGSRGDAELRAWWSASPHRQRIEIVEQPVPCQGTTTGVALIVNSAYEHGASIGSVLAAGYNAVCEKPLTFSKRDTLELLARADKLHRALFCTNTYLFADYLRVLRRDWLQGKRFLELQFTWSDAKAEVRHGHTKNYDSSVPVIVDVLPHIASIVLATYGELKINRSDVVVHQGGRAVTARFDSGDLTVRVNLSRDSSRRIRLAQFSGPESQVTIDFASEPGVVSVGCEEGVCVDPSWDSKRKPIAQMLNSVKAYFERGALDERLSPKAALLGNDMIDGVASGYVQQQIDFLVDQARAQGPSCDADFAYAAKESQSIRQRALPFLSQESPLRRLAMLPSAERVGHLELNQPGKGSF